MCYCFCVVYFIYYCVISVMVINRMCKLNVMICVVMYMVVVEWYLYRLLIYERCVVWLYCICSIYLCVCFELIYWICVILLVFDFFD